MDCSFQENVQILLERNQKYLIFFQWFSCTNKFNFLITFISNIWIRSLQENQINQAIWKFYGILIKFPHKIIKDLSIFSKIL